MHCRGCACSANTAQMGPGAGAAASPQLKASPTQGHLKRKALRDIQTRARTLPLPPRGLRKAKYCSQRQSVTPWRTPASAQTSRAGSRAPSQKLPPLSRTGPEGEVLVGNPCGKVGRERPPGDFPRFHFGENLRTASAAGSPPSKANPQRKRSSSHSRRRGGLKRRRRCGKGASQVSGLNVAEVLQLPTRLRKEIPSRSQESRKP